MVVALIVAAGRGERLGADGPKALAELAGRPLLQWSVDVLIESPTIERVVVALPEGARAPAGTIGVRGGAVRSESVRLALAAAGGGSDSDLVLIHDAARPLLTAELVAATLAAVQHEGVDAAIAAAPVTDTIKRAAATLSGGAAEGASGGGEIAEVGTGEGGTGEGAVASRSLPVVGETLDRAELWAVQTPQVFRRGILERALDVPDDVLSRATDDAWLVERAGGRVVIVPAPHDNLKVTTPLDLALAGLLVARRGA